MNKRTLHQVTLCWLICALASQAVIAGNALRFNRDQFWEVTVPHSESINIGGQGFTVECWVYPENMQDAPAQIIAAKGGQAGIAPDSKQYRQRTADLGIAARLPSQ